MPKRTFNEPSDMLQKFEDYLVYADSRNEVVTRPGFYLYAGMSRQGFNQYRQRYPEFEDVQGYIDAYCENVLLQRGLSSDKNIFEMFLLKAQFKYVDKPQSVVNFEVAGNLNYLEMKDSDLEKQRDKFLKNRQKEEDRKLLSSK